MGYAALSHKKSGFLVKSVKLVFSKTQIDRAGESLKKANIPEEELDDALKVLSNWRAYHAMPLDTFAKVLKERVKKVSKNSNPIVAQRLKRTPSILLKLNNHSTMRLSTMQDIGGLRAIFDTVDEVYELVDVYRRSKTRHALFSFNDYIDIPKNDGYRSVHMVYKLARTPKIFLEIQMRSHLQHIWATGVEVFGTLKNSSFKSGHGDNTWLEFFSLLSSVFALKENTPVLQTHNKLSKDQLLKRTKQMIEKLKVGEQLNVYTALYKISSLKSHSGRRGNYSLLLLDSKKNQIKLKTYGASQIEEATNTYLALEKRYFDNTNMNVVLVNTGDIKKLEISYPNYFMDTKSLVNYLNQIVMDVFL